MVSFYMNQPISDDEQPNAEDSGLIGAPTPLNAADVQLDGIDLAAHAGSHAASFEAGQEENCGVGRDEKWNMCDPRSVVVVGLPRELFSSKALKDRFEEIITQNGTIKGAQFYYLTIFRRCRIDFDRAEDAIQAKMACSEISLCDVTARTYFMKPFRLRPVRDDSLCEGEPADSDGCHIIQEHLRPPQPEKAFLISPPASPPMGWQQTVEPPPVVNQDELIRKLQALQAQESTQIHEILPGTKHTPRILVVPACGGLANNIRRSSQFKPTRRPD